MKRIVLIIGVLLCCLTVRAQSVAYTLHYWFDENHAQMQSSELGEGSFLVDAEGLTDGLHAFHILLEGEGLATTQTFLFMKVTQQPASENYTFHYWFDENDAQKQSSSLGNGLFLLDSEGLSEGLHSLHVLVKGNELATTQTYLFLKAQAQPSVSGDLTLRYWFDENDTQMQSSDLGEGLFLLNADGLNDGLHALHILLDGGGLTTTQSYLFMKMPPQPDFSGDVTYHVWFDEDDAQMQSGNFGDGLLLIDADGLEPTGFHDVHILLEGSGLTTTLTYQFVKLDSGICVFNGDADIYWSNIENWSWSIFPQPENGVLVNGICQLDEDATVASLTVSEDQSLTIPADRMLSVTGSVTSEEATRLIIEEGGQLMHSNVGVQATVQKTVLPYTDGENDGWHLIASPLADNVAVTLVDSLLSNEYDLYYYDEPSVYWMNVKEPANNFTAMENGKGYMYANSDEVNLGFAGELQDGSAMVIVPLDYTEGVVWKGFNLVGNPFAYNVTSYASNNVADGCFVMNDTKDDFIVSVVTEDNPLKPAEGFFVKATAADAYIIFNPNRSAKSSHKGSIRLEVVENGKLIDRLIVKKDGEPLEKLSLKENRTKLFAQQNRQEMSIVPCEGDEQAVSFKAGKNGSYTIQVSVEGLEFDYLHLIDNLTGADVDLLVEPSYTFEAKASDYASRFRLVFSICEDANGDNETIAYFNGSEWVVSNTGRATLQVVDMLGHVLSSETVNGNATLNLKEAPGVYTIRLIRGDNVMVQKIVVE